MGWNENVCQKGFDLSLVSWKYLKKTMAWKERSREKIDKNRVVKLKKTMAKLKAVFLKISLDLRFNRNMRDISVVAIIYFQIQ